MLIQSRLPCDSCGSSDAVSEYDNGTYCFSCHHSTYKFSSRPTNYTNDYKTIECPYRVQNVTKNGLADCFLRERHFTQSMYFLYNLQESTDGNFLVLPGIREGKRQFLEIRNLNPERIKAPKYQTVGTKKILYLGNRLFNWFDQKGLKIIIVEDMLSCMRVGLRHNCVALRGTSLSEEVLSIFCQLSPATHLYLWLDSDIPGQKATEKIIDKLSWLGNPITKILTEKDPKMYTDTEITSILAKAGYHDV